MATKPKQAAAKSSATKTVPAKTAGTNGARRFWLMYPPRLITTPVIWQLAQTFPIITNVRQASVTDEIGIVCLELHGKADDIERAVQWLEKTGVKVEPVEINVVES